MLHVITDFYEAAKTKDIQFLYDLYYLFIYLFKMPQGRLCQTLDVATEICILITGNLSVLNVGVSF